MFRPKLNGLWTTAQVKMTNRRFRGTDSWLPAAWKALINEIDAYFDSERLSGKTPRKNFGDFHLQITNWLTIL